MSFCEKLNKNLVNETLEDFLKDQEGTQNYNALLEIVESIIKDKNFEKTSMPKLDRKLLYGVIKFFRDRFQVRRVNEILNWLENKNDFSKKVSDNSQKMAGTLIERLKKANHIRLEHSTLDEPEILPFLQEMNNYGLFTVSSDVGDTSDVSNPVEKGLYYVQFGYVFGFYPTAYVDKFEKNLSIYFPSRRSVIVDVLEVVVDPSKYYNQQIVTEGMSTQPGYFEAGEIITANLSSNIDINAYRQLVKDQVSGDGYSPVSPAMSELYNQKLGLNQQFTLINIKCSTPNVNCIENGFFSKVIQALKKTNAKV